jgi:tetratricopeptide (TPR) repeat protein
MNDESLDAIGMLEGTDKTALVQDYLRHYQRIFAAIRHEPITLLEIGVAGGASLRTWARFFPRASIVGADIDERCRVHATDRITVEIGSQADPEFLAGLARKHKADVIIDDGSHMASHMLSTFHQLIPFLSPGGYYVIEDVYLHYGEFSAQWHGTGGITPAAYFSKIAEQLSSGHIDPDCDAMTRYVCTCVDSIEFIRGAIVARKRLTEDPDKQLIYFWDMAERSSHSYNWSELSRLLMQRHNLDAAEIAIRRALAIEPDNTRHLSRLAHTLARRGDRNGAVEVMRDATRLAPNDPNVRALLTHFEKDDV